MLAHANALAADCYQTDGTNDNGTLRFRRDMSNRFIPRYESPQRQARALTAFRNYVGVIDAARNVSNILGYGLLR